MFDKLLIFMNTFEFCVGPNRSASLICFAKNGILQWWNLGKPLNLNIFSKGPPVPLNILTPTPAPDRGGLVACLGGPVAFRCSPVAWIEYPSDARLSFPNIQ